MDDIITTFYEKVWYYNINWEVAALISKNGNLHTLGSDSKIIGRIFEIIVEPILNEIAKEKGHIIETPEQQTIYPDFIIYDKDEPNKKIAIDIKSTYRKINKNGSVSKYKFALGSYASYMRNNTKNIAYPYNHFDKHYVIGFIYTRNARAQSSNILPISSLENIEPPYKDVEFFIQEKYKISGYTAGSGNTENIGSFPVNDISILKSGNGPFSFLGKEIYEDYWKNFPKYREANPKFNNLETYFNWLERNNQNNFDISKIKTLYMIWKSNFES